jgi:hypothetical protein
MSEYEFNIRNRNENENLKFGDNGDGTTYVQVRDTGTGQTDLSRYVRAIKDINYGSISYYAFIDIDGNYYIEKDDGTSHKFYKGSGGVSSMETDWTNRAGLTYGYYNEIF